MADGKTYRKKMADGGLIKSKTSWEGEQLVTKSKEQSTLGSMEIVESRSLSADGNTLTINLSFKGSSSHWTEKAVYTKAKSEPKGRESTSKKNNILLAQRINESIDLAHFL